MKHSSRIILFLFVFLAGGLAGYLVRDRVTSDPGSPLNYASIKDSRFKYTHPLLDVLLDTNAPQNTGLRPFKNSVEKLIHEDMDRKWADTVSIYFRDLNNGPWFSIGEMNEFYPASLLKVPLMIAVLKDAETKPDILRNKILYAASGPADSRNQQSNNLETGRQYTVEELLGRMIRYSDNVSTLLLLKFVSKKTLESTYLQLGIIEAGDGSDHADLLSGTLSEHKFTIPQYASFFRVLYNASYLNREMSEKALGLLARTDFTEGLNAGVPSSVEVAHKWGYRELGVHGKIKQLHDCGIIYYPGSPYLLCIMTSGNSFEYLDDAIREISGVVYTEVDRQKRHGQ